MTEPRGHARTPKPRPSTRATTIKVTAASLTAAAALTGGLAAQMAFGHDPALGAGNSAGASSKATAAQGAQSDNAAPPPATVVTRSS